jgi:uncharacterized protein (DUF1697 family)
MRWQKGVAFIRGINMYGSNSITQDEMIGLCKSIENNQVKILGVFKLDNIIFQKRGIHYASVGGMLERVLSKHFKRAIHVTARSVRTLEGCLEWEKSSK